MWGLELFENSSRLLETLGQIGRFRKLRLGSTPHDVIHQENKLRLLRYESPEGTVASGPPVLLIPSLINRHYILDLMPGKSLVEFLVKAGFPVYLIDWGTPGDEDRYVPFERYVDSYIDNAVDAVLADTGSDQAVLVGYCLGGTMAAIYSALHPEKVGGLVALTAPFNFHNSGLLSAWCRARHYNVDNLTEAHGNVPWTLMQSSFHLLRPTLNATRSVGLLKRLWDDEFIDGFWALELWANDNVSFPGECYREFISRLYRANSLVNGTFKIRGKKVDFGAMTCPILNVAAEQDHIVPSDAIDGFRSIAPRQDFTDVVTPGGHIGAIISRKASRELWPKIVSWIHEKMPAERSPLVASKKTAREMAAH